MRMRAQSGNPARGAPETFASHLALETFAARLAPHRTELSEIDRYAQKLTNATPHQVRAAKEGEWR